tara:strand:+ start:699 stop:1166 length:468 start_codon:yes stop_codon:yes gene_type:complete
MAGFKKDDDENTYLAGEFHSKMMHSEPIERMKYFNKFTEKIKERKKNKKDKKNPDASLKEGSVFKEGGQVPSSDARTRGKKYHMGGSVDQMNPTQPTNQMNPTQPTNRMGPKPPSGGGNQPMDHEWWGGWRMRGDARPKDPDFATLLKKGGKVKK